LVGQDRGSGCRRRGKLSTSNKDVVGVVIRKMIADALRKKRNDVDRKVSEALVIIRTVQ
jgi:hypothetical protein